MIPDIIVDNQRLNDILFITSVSRMMGPVKTRKIQVDAVIKSDVLASVDVLNKLLTGDLQTFVFTDQPDRYWLGRVDSDITPKPYGRDRAQVSFNIQIPSGVSYAVTPKEYTLGPVKSYLFDNQGSEATHPVVDFHIKAPTYMVSVASQGKVFQYGEPLSVSLTSTPKPSLVQVSKRWNELETGTMDLSTISDTTTSGTFVRRDTPQTETVTTTQRIQAPAEAPTTPTGRVTVRQEATHWQTGERIASWVIGKTFDYDKIKTVNQSYSTKAYRLKSGGTYLGWLLEQDVARTGGSETTQTTTTQTTTRTRDYTEANRLDMCPDYGDASGWSGPVMVYTLPNPARDWQMTCWLNFGKTRPDSYGSCAVGVKSTAEVLGQVKLQAIDNDMTMDIISRSGNHKQSMIPGRRVTAGMWGSITITKQDQLMTYSVYNDLTKQTVTTSETISKDLASQQAVAVYFSADHWQGAEPIGEISAASLRFQTYEKDQPTTILQAGDQVRLDMRDNTAYLNGVKSLTPIAYGSSNVAIAPGKNELAFVSDVQGGQAPDVEVYYREVWR